MKKFVINENWKFYREGQPAEWVQCPHDAMLSEKRDPDLTEGSASGYFPGGKYTYERTISSELCGKTVIAEFEGIYRHATVYLNDEQIGENSYGYTNFFLDLSDKLSSESNLLRIVVDNAQTPNARWYTGSGIYRNVNLYIGGTSYFIPQGAKVKTLSLDPARISVQCAIHNFDGCKVVAKIKCGNRIVACAEGDAFEVEIPNAKYWSAECPNLYTLQLFLTKDGVIVDEETIPFGLRSIAWNAEEGLLINGEPVKLKGGCIHHDNGILGARSFREAGSRKLKRLKEAGYNAIRFSHYPIGKEMLALCDELGLYVLDEAFDVWKIPKNTYDYALDFDQNWQRDIDAMVEKDFNHPSVIMYSIGNEITDMGFPFGGAICKMLCDEVRRLDPCRPITCGLNVIMTYLAQRVEKIKQDKEKYFGSQEFNSLAAIQERLNQIADAITAEEIEETLHPIFECLDIIGFNYGERYYERLHALKPKYVFLSTETYPKHIYENWERVTKLPYLIGDFMWTAWDYLGECGVGLPVYGETRADFAKPYPCLTASCGSFDLIGNAEAQARYTSVVWGNTKPYIVVRPVDHSGEKVYIGEWRLTDAIESWDWRGFEGRTAEIEVYNRGEAVELFLNGESLGTQKTEEFKASFRIPYENGELRADVLRDGKVVASASLKTPDTRLSLNVQQEEKAIERGDILFVDVTLADEEGNIAVSDRREVEISVENGRLLAFGNADPCNERSFLAPLHDLYHGRALAVIEAERGKLVIKVSAKDLPTQCLELQVK